MKSNYKTTSTTPCVKRETNLMRHLTAWLEDGYCSITVAHHQLITVIRFISKNYIRPWKDFTNRLHLILHAKIRDVTQNQTHRRSLDAQPPASTGPMCLCLSVPRRSLSKRCLGPQVHRWHPQHYHIYVVTDHDSSGFFTIKFYSYIYLDQNV